MTDSSTSMPATDACDQAVVVKEQDLDSAAAVSAAGMRDQMLDEIRAGRRLDKIVSSIENFLDNQVSKLERAMLQCDAAVDNDRIVKEILQRHQEERERWEQERETERARLQEAGEELARAWEKLEEERRNWIENRDRSDNRKSR